MTRDKRRMALGGWMVAALLAACGEVSGPPPAAPTHDLVFEGLLDSVPELLVLDSVGATPRRLLAPGTVVMDPEPSPDGTRIAFVVADYVNSTGDIFLMNRDGSGVRQLTFDPELDDQPTWSPDGARIAFRSFRTQRDGDIWVMDADGGNLVNLTPDPLPGVTDERRPAWSPDGARIAWASNAGGNVDIWVMRADGSNKIRLTNTADLDTEPAWSPDGQALAFRRSNTAAGSDIYLVAATGGTPVPLALAGEQRMPVFTPAGDHLVFVNQATVMTRADLYRMRTDGTAVTPLVRGDVAGGSINPAYLLRP